MAGKNILVAFGMLLASGPASAQSFRTDVAPLIESSCLACHDASTETNLNLETLGHDLSKAENFLRWEEVFDRVAEGEMPPKSEQRPDALQLNTTLDSLKKHLREASLAKQAMLGRVPARRLTKLELGFTLRDLLWIDSDVTSGIPDEVESGNFDTVGAQQRISAVHMESYLEAADEALKLAIHLGKNPYNAVANDFVFAKAFQEMPLNQGGNITRSLEVGNGIALFVDNDYMMRLDFGVTNPGIHRITAKVAAYQSTTPVTAKFIVKEPSGGARLVKAIDLKPGEPQTVVVDTFLKPGDVHYLTLVDDKTGYIGVASSGGAKNYKGKGLAILSQQVEGPIFDSWPPPSTRQLLSGMELRSSAGAENGPFTVSLAQDPLREITQVVRHLAPRVFRRHVSTDELQPFIELARPAIDAGRDWVDILQIPLRSMLSSPQFLLLGGQPGELDSYALANRLSYFLWKSMPDEQLLALAQDGKLSDSKVLDEQIDRMLSDEKSNRFVKDFIGQWLRINKVNVTSPDAGLYPEFDELLSDSIPQETELFFAELIRENLSLTNLIDSDFTFVNRRLAEHYGIQGVAGQEFRKIEIPDGSPRGGVLTQAAILKTTANGTTTSPVTRGNFVLSNFLGTPPSPPPPGVGSIEPDTRGQTTIREILAAHRKIESCNQCHREIDPPGFAMESFDPIGGFRTYYRASSGEQKFGDFTAYLPPKQGPAVDPSGETVDGQQFSGIEQYKNYLLDQKEQVARNFISQLVVYSTGGEIEFADREGMEAILDRTRQADFPVKDIIHQVIQSKIFLCK